MESCPLQKEVAHEEARTSGVDGGGPDGGDVDDERFARARAQEEDLTVFPNNVTVSIYDNYFSPKSITIPVGTAVTFDNKGEVTHNVTGKWGGFMDLKPGSSPWTVPFGPASAGKTYSYYDEYYPGMEGSITFARG